jgi:hypothetical protein
MRNDSVRTFGVTFNINTGQGWPKVAVFGSIDISSVADAQIRPRQYQTLRILLGIRRVRVPECGRVGRVAAKFPYTNEGRGWPKFNESSENAELIMGRKRGSGKHARRVCLSRLCPVCDIVEEVFVAVSRVSALLTTIRIVHFPH